MTGDDAFIRCPACGDTQTYPVLKAKDHTVSGETFTVYECRSCALRFTSPVPDAGHIAAYYKSEDYISHSDTRSGVINKLYHAVRKLSLKQKKQWVEQATGLKTGNLLDIGCGTGAFLHVMKQAGWMTTGLEPDAQARTIAQTKYQLSTLSPDELYHLPAQSFHAITLWHVLEHVHDLQGYLEQMHRLLHPKGKLFVAVPNYSSRDAKKYGVFWAAYDVPRHLYHFTPKAFASLAQKHGLHLTGQQAMPFDGFYISLLSEKYMHGKTRYLQGFLTGLRSWTYARKHPANASSILYILQP
ncbi:MAG TPA: class I SAM-dependent methyltransferase [Chitinophagaceae bacterium]|nr:class I SAM-dependent methyltransferase [Chitinophagaceae bacterium]